MLLAAIAIKLDSKGPVFFKQKRHGFNNELIEVYKFRSMYTDMTDRPVQKIVTKDDPRVTRVGRFIRKTSIDELPQLFNVVLKGNLSLVGPRPHAVAGQGREPPLRRGGRRLFRPPPGEARHHRLGADQWLARRDRHRREDPQRVEHDLYYIENWSLLLDLYILVMTPSGAAEIRERLLMIAPAQHASSLLRSGSAAPGLSISAERLRCAMLWLTGACGAIVFIEPSPYEVDVVSHHGGVRHRRDDAAAGAGAARRAADPDQYRL